MKRRPWCLSSAGALSIVVLAGLVTAAGCRSTSPCNAGTVLVTVTFDGTTSAADALDVAVSVDGGAPKTTSLPHTAGDPRGSVEVDFPNGTGYPEGKRLDVTVVARAAGAALGTATASVAMLPGGCGTVAVSFGAPGTDGGARQGRRRRCRGQGRQGWRRQCCRRRQRRQRRRRDRRSDTGCTSGTTRSCAADGYLGNCAAGTETCAAGKWSACSISPLTKDSCASKGDDATCNGTPNEGCACLDVDPARLVQRGRRARELRQGNADLLGRQVGRLAASPRRPRTTAPSRATTRTATGRPTTAAPASTETRRRAARTRSGSASRGRRPARAVSGARASAPSTRRRVTARRRRTTTATGCRTTPSTWSASAAARPPRPAAPTRATTATAPARPESRAASSPPTRPPRPGAPARARWGPRRADSCMKGNDDSCNGTANEGCACVSTDVPRSAPRPARSGTAPREPRAAPRREPGAPAASSLRPRTAARSRATTPPATARRTRVAPASPATPSRAGRRRWGSASRERRPAPTASGERAWGAVNKGARDCTSAADNDCDGSPDNTIDLVCTCTAGKTPSLRRPPGEGRQRTLQGGNTDLRGRGRQDLLGLGRPAAARWGRRRPTPASRATTTTAAARPTTAASASTTSRPASAAIATTARRPASTAPSEATPPASGRPDSPSRR